MCRQGRPTIIVPFLGLLSLEGEIYTHLLLCVPANYVEEPTALRFKEGAVMTARPVALDQFRCQNTCPCIQAMLLSFVRNAKAKKSEQQADLDRQSPLASRPQVQCLPFSANLSTIVLSSQDLLQEVSCSVTPTPLERGKNRSEVYKLSVTPGSHPGSLSLAEPQHSEPPTCKIAPSRCQ